MLVSILENGRHLGFLIGPSGRIDLVTIEMPYANFGACITICTIHPKNACYLLHYMGPLRPPWPILYGSRVGDPYGALRATHMGPTWGPDGIVGWGGGGWLSHGLVATLSISYSLDGCTLWGFTRHMRLTD